MQSGRSSVSLHLDLDLSEGTVSTCVTPTSSLASPSSSQDEIKGNAVEAFKYSIENQFVIFTEPNTEERCILKAPPFLVSISKIPITELYTKNILERITQHPNYRNSAQIKVFGMLHPWCILRVENSLRIALDAKIGLFAIDLLRVLERVSYSVAEEAYCFTDFESMTQNAVQNYATFNLVLHCNRSGQDDPGQDINAYLPDINDRFNEVVAELFRDYPENYNSFAAVLRQFSPSASVAPSPRSGASTPRSATLSPRLIASMSNSAASSPRSITSTPRSNILVPTLNSLSRSQSIEIKPIDTAAAAAAQLSSPKMSPTSPTSLNRVVEFFLNRNSEGSPRSLRTRSGSRLQNSPSCPSNPQSNSSQSNSPHQNNFRLQVSTGSPRFHSNQRTAPAENLDITLNSATRKVLTS